jgi:4a-hydroxytetrahydrobiopterin dehydratase
MARPATLDEGEIATRLRDLPAWTVRSGKLHRELAFRDFVEAFSFMTAAALTAEAMGHHPEWFNVWNRVTVDLMTHDAAGITTLDFQLAAAMERLAGERQAA